MTRHSIVVEGFHHGPQPIPAASRVGDLVVTGGIYGLDPDTGTIPENVEEQVRLMFANLRRILEAAGTTFDDVVRVTVFVKIPEARAAVNAEWVAAFPDPASRPARHTLQYDHLPENLVVQCDAMAWASRLRIEGVECSDAQPTEKRK